MRIIYGEMTKLPKYMPYSYIQLMIRSSFKVINKVVRVYVQNLISVRHLHDAKSHMKQFL